MTSPNDGETIDRPSDLDIVLYINDLELALADARAMCLTNSERMARVHSWAVHYGARAVILDGADSEVE